MGSLLGNDEVKQVVNDIFLKSFPKRLLKKKKSYWLLDTCKASSHMSVQQFVHVVLPLFFVGHLRFLEENCVVVFPCVIFLFQF